MNAPNTIAEKSEKNGKSAIADASKATIDGLLSGELVLDNGNIVASKEQVMAENIDYTAIREYLNASGMDKNAAEPLLHRIDNKAKDAKRISAWNGLAASANATKGEDAIDFAAHQGVTALVRHQQDANQTERKNARKTTSAAARGEDLELSKLPAETVLKILGNVVKNKATLVAAIDREIDRLATCLEGSGQLAYVSADGGKTKMPVIDAIVGNIWPLKIDKDAKSAFLKKARIVGSAE